MARLPRHAACGIWDNEALGARTMKRLLLLALAGALLAPPIAEARDPRWGSGLQMQAQEQHPKKRPDQFRRERDKRGGHDKRRQNKLTDEERRELHRDLDRANREIYRR
jgi:hypothetical protein